MGDCAAKLARTENLRGGRLRPLAQGLLRAKCKFICKYLGKTSTIIVKEPQSGLKKSQAKGNGMDPIASDARG